MSNYNDDTDGSKSAAFKSDEEAAGANAWRNQPSLDRYRDDEDADDEDETSPDATLRPSIDYDGLSIGNTPPRWQQSISDRIPLRVKNGWRATKEWVKGPNPPRIFHINPIFPQIQHAPLALLDRYAPKKIQRFSLLILLYACWLFTFSLVIWKSSAASEIAGYGNPVQLRCAAHYWSDGNECGINGDGCRPFTNASLAFRCPADCRKQLMAYPHAVGDQEIQYQPLAVGGPMQQQTGFEDVIHENAIYRGDSFICAAAVHAGFIKDSEGGCGVLTLTGEQSNYPQSKAHKIPSVGFDSYFPQSFGFLAGSRSECKDLRWPALIPSVFFTSVLSLFTTSPAVHFWSIFVALFLHVGIISDPPPGNFYDLLSTSFGRLLPASFCAWITYRYAVKRSLTGLTAQIEKTVLWLGAAWVGALNNYTFDRIPIQRLTPSDLAQPGAIPALVIIVLLIFAIALGQAWSFRLEGRMPRYLLIYGVLTVSVIVMLILPGLSLRIHHYILGLLFLPGTSFQNRPSLVYQGLLLGLFINGIARWGFASILETPAALLQGAAQGTLLPTVSVLAIAAKNITFDLGRLPTYDARQGRSYDGVSILVNDVERFRGYSDDVDYWDGAEFGSGNFTWTWKRRRPGRDAASVDELELEDGGDVEEDTAVETMPEYFRFAYMDGSAVGDYTKAGKWDQNGEWIEMQNGPS